MTNQKDIQLSSYKQIYFVGIGGIGMSALARYFHFNSFNVCGYDKTTSPLTEKLAEEGISIHYEDLGENIPETHKNSTDTLVIYTPAIPADHKEFNFFKENKFTLLKRAQVLGLLTQNSKGLGVAGTHGKTTTSTLLAYILSQSKLECNAFLGGIASNFNSNLVVSRKSDYTVVEADEFDRSFLQLSPFASIITSTDADHLDIYGDEKVFRQGFIDYANLIAPEGFLIQKYGVNLATNATNYTYDLENKKADYYGTNLRFENESFLFDFNSKNINWKNIHFGLPGIHNAENAVACIAMCLHLGLTENEIRSGLKNFKGVKRRFEYHFKSKDIVYIDDYAHHPTEIKALIASIKLLYPDRKIMGIFQPHLFSRTKDFQDDFAKELSKIDDLLLLPIYPARELPIEGITSEMLLSKIDTVNKKVVLPKDVLTLCNKMENGVILTIGAGDIDRLVQPIHQLLKSKNDE